VETRTLGRTARPVSVIGLGCWQLGGDWGEVSEDDARRVLHAALDAGVTFLDTADVYGDGRSEKLVGAVIAERHDTDDVVVATKAGRRADPHIAENYTPAALRGWIDRSRANLGVERIDLLQLHCPPSGVYRDDELFGALDELAAEGVLAAYGVSVETCEQALAVIARPNVASVQLIANVFRQKPSEQVLPAAVDAGVGVVVRVPLASGLLSGKYTTTTNFADDDHRTFNRDGAAFDVGETFAGVPFEVGVEAARELARLAPVGMSPAQLALRFVLDQPGVTTVIPGARNEAQVEGNVAAAALPPLDADVHAALRELYDRSIREHVHDRW
jgi:aryl-alcohol dehydrogenase-like predicted oxidoreductase